MSDQPFGRAARLDHALADLLSQAPELEAAAVVSYDGLAMASALPLGMDEDRVAAMSAALLSLGEKAAQGLGRGDLSQVYVEGETGTVFLVSCDDEAVLVAVAAAGAKAGLMLFEVRRASAAIAEVLRVAAPPAPSIVDDSALADAEAAYQAHKDAIAESERAFAAQQVAQQAALVPLPTPILVPVDDEPLHAPTPIGTVYHPDTPLEPTPSLTLASWMTAPQAESSRS